jgi:hypothetical protein
MRVLLVLILIAAVVFGYWYLNSPPTVRTGHDLKVIGGATPVKVSLEDRSGLRQLRMWWEQGGKTIPVIQVDLGKVKQSEVQLTLGPRQQKGLRDGDARLVLEASDAAWISKKQSMSWEVSIHSRPPQLSVLSTQHYVNQGGCDMVVYQVSSSATWSGVRVGQHLYPGYQMPGVAQPGTHFALFAFPYNEPASTVPVVVARDAAGNEATATFTYKLFPKFWHRSEIQLTDAAMQKMVPPILAHAPELQPTGDLLKDFLAINGRLRRINNDFIKKMGAQTEKRFLWNEVFTAIGKWEAEFADHRTYFYNGKQVDEQDHLGFDLANVQNSPVEAANRGKVILADWLGIFGNTIIIDHGYGLQSMYGHLASFEVKPGDMVEKGQVIGHSDTTGLALGDHVHFSMLLDGDQINAKEWWDWHWIHDRLLAKLPNQQFPGSPQKQP